MGWLLPVGTPGGINSGFEDMPAGSGLVRRGGQLLCLDRGAYRLWRAAAAALQSDELLSWGSDLGITDVGGRLGELKEAGLLIEETSDVHAVVGRLAVRLVGECLGNGTEIRPDFLVLGRNNTQLRLDAFLFEILLRSDGVTPVAAICRQLDELRQPGQRPSIETLTAGLPALVRNEVVQLDGVAA